MTSPDPESELTQGVHEPVSEKLGVRIACALQVQGHDALRRVAVTEKNGVITLRGNVSNDYLIQLALEIVRRDPDVREVINTISIRGPQISVDSEIPPAAP
jgi:osmotically-inducible protein OsmY